MELRVLKYFVTIVQERSISNAAKYLHLSQPTLSKQIKQLEIELSVELFKRGNREIILTEVGQYFYNRSKEIIQLVDNTTNNLMENQIVSGELTIGGGETIAMQCIAKIVHKLTEKNPEVKINLFSGQADEVTQKLDKGLVDFGVVMAPVDKQKYEYLKLPVVDKWGLLVKDSHPLYKMEYVTPADIVEIPLLLFNQSLVNNQIADWLGKNLDNINIVGTYNLLYNASLMVKEEVGAALCIEGITNTEETSLQFIPLFPELTADLFVVWKKSHVFSNAASLFLIMLNEAIRAQN